MNFIRPENKLIQLIDYHFHYYVFPSYLAYYMANEKHKKIHFEDFKLKSLFSINKIQKDYVYYFLNN
jgi:hypothetical protein